MQNGCVVRVDSVADTDLCAPSTAVEDCLCTNQTRPKIKVSAGCLTFDLVNQLSAFESVCGHDTLIAAIKHVEKEASIGGWDASALVQSLSNHQRIWACFNQTDASGKLEDPKEDPFSTATRSRLPTRTAEPTSRGRLRPPQFARSSPTSP